MTSPTPQAMEALPELPRPDGFSAGLSDPRMFGVEKMHAYARTAVSAALAATQSKLGEAIEAQARAERNRDMWKGQSERQAAALTEAHAAFAPAQAEQETKWSLQEKWSRLYSKAHALIAAIGHRGQIGSDDEETTLLMDALHEIDGGQWMPGLMPSPAQAEQAMGEAHPMYVALDQAHAYISRLDHGENCFLHDDGGEYDACFCGKESALSAIEQAQEAALASRPSPTVEQAKPVPSFRGYARLGIGQYILNHTPAGDEPELVISIANEADKSGARQVGEDRDNEPGLQIQPETIAVRIAFTSEAGLAVLEKQLSYLRAVHFTSPQPQDTDRIDAERYRALWTPEVRDFIVAIEREALHQRDRWGSEHDAGKTDADWFWLIGYLAGKAIRPDCSSEKRLHHIVTTAAACLNWHAAAIGAHTAMRPGIDDPDAARAAKEQR